MACCTCASSWRTLLRVRRRRWWWGLLACSAMQFACAPASLAPRHRAPPTARCIVRCFRRAVLLPMHPSHVGNALATRPRRRHTIMLQARSNAALLRSSGWGISACTQHPHPHARRTSASPLLHAGDVCGRACMRACRPRQVQAVRACRRHAVVVKAWGEPVDFSAAKVVSNKSLFPGMHQIMLDVGKDVAAGYSKPGQYVQVSRSHAHGRACVVESARRLHRAADLATRPRTHAPARHTHAHTPRPRSSPTESPASSPSRPPLLTAPPSSCSSRLRRARPRATSSRSTRAAP